MSDTEKLPVSFTEPGSDPVEERRRTDEVKEWFLEDTSRGYLLFEHLKDVALSLKIRFVRAMDGKLPLPETSLPDYLLTDEPKYLYYLFESLQHPLSETSFETLKNFVNRSPVWLSASASSALAESYTRDPDFLRQFLRVEDRGPVLIRTLKTLYDRRAEEFSEVLQGLLTDQVPRQVEFYAAVLLKATEPESFETMTSENEYLSTIRDAVSVTNPSQELVHD